MADVGDVMINILSSIVLYLAYPYLKKCQSFDLFETEEELNQLNKSETVKLTGDYCDYRRKYYDAENNMTREVLEEYPPSIKFYQVAVWFHWELNIFYMFVPIVIASLCQRTKFAKHTKKLPLLCLKVFELVNVSGFFIYAQLIGPTVGFQWKHLTSFYYTGFVSPFKLAFVIWLGVKSYKYMKKKVQLVYPKRRASCDMSNEELEVTTHM